MNWSVPDLGYRLYKLTVIDVNFLNYPIDEGVAMTKADLIEQIIKANRYSKKDAAELVEQVFEVIKDTLGQGEDLRLSGFGNFTVRKKADRQGRNPQTGETITITARRVLAFKPSAVLRGELNR